jgi:hypothetical protein
MTRVVFALSLPAGSNARRVRRVVCKERVPCSWPLTLREAFLSYKNMAVVQKE